MKNLKTLAGAVLACGILAGCGSSNEEQSTAEKQELHIFTWSDYIAQEVIDGFEEKYNCKVVVDTFDSNEAMYAKLQAGSTGYDIIMPTSYQIPLMAKNKMIQKLDHAKLPNFKKNFDKGYASATIDATFEYGVPYAVTYTGLAYRKDKVGNAPIDSWKVLDTAAMKGRMSLLRTRSATRRSTAGRCSTRPPSRAACPSSATCARRSAALSSSSGTRSTPRTRWRSTRPPTW